MPREENGRDLIAPLLAAACLLAFLIFGGAAPAAADTTAELETPLGSFFRSGTETVLLVTVTADQAVTGTIDVRMDGASAVTFVIEVPGGSSKTFAAPVIVAPWGPPAEVVVQTSDGQTRRVTANLQQTGDIQPVAVLPSLVGPGLPERAELSVDVGQARLLPFDPANLDFGPSALSAAAGVAATQGDLGNLSESQRTALLAWVSAGGLLYVDGSVDELQQGVLGRSLDGVTWSSESGESGVVGRAWLGAGSVLATGDAMASGRFDGLIRPGYVNQQEFEQFIDPGQLLSDLSSDAGFRTRPIGPFVAVLLGYIALVGPLLWLFLSRTRREPAMWFAIPGLAVLFSVGIWGSGLFFRQGTTGSHVTVIGTSGTAGRSASDYMISSSGGGFTGIGLDDGWTASTSGGTWDWRFREAGFATPTAQGDRLGADVPPAGVVVLAATNRGAVESPWTVELSVDGADITGTVTNRTGYELSDVVVFSGDQVSRLPALDAGASVPFELRNVSVPPMWENPVQMQLARDVGQGGPSSPAGLLRWMSSVGLQVRSGQIVVVGWTTEAPAPLNTLGGSAVVKGRTGFVASEAVSGLDARGSAGVPVSAATTRARVLDFRWSGDIGGGMVSADRRGAFEGEVQTVAYDLPPGADTGSLVLEVPAQVAAVDLWVDGRWTDGHLTEAGNGLVVIRLPGGAVDGGSVHIRSLSQGAFNTPSVRSATAEEWTEAFDPQSVTAETGEAAQDEAASDATSSATTIPGEAPDEEAGGAGATTTVTRGGG